MRRAVASQNCNRTVKVELTLLGLSGLAHRVGDVEVVGRKDQRSADKDQNLDRFIVKQHPHHRDCRQADKINRHDDAGWCDLERVSQAEMRGQTGKANQDYPWCRLY